MVQGKKTKKNIDIGQSNLIDSLLSKGGSKKTKISSQKYDAPQKPKKQVSFGHAPSGKIVKSSNSTQIINNFHKAISSTKSDDIILKMLDLKEKDIIVFYKNLENLIGKDMSSKIKTNMAGQLQSNKFVSNVKSVPDLARLADNICPVIRPIAICCSPYRDNFSLNYEYLCKKHILNT